MKNAVAFFAAICCLAARADVPQSDVAFVPVKRQAPVIKRVVIAPIVKREDPIVPKNEQVTRPGETPVLIKLPHQEGQSNPHYLGGIKFQPVWVGFVPPPRW